MSIYEQTIDGKSFLRINAKFKKILLLFHWLVNIIQITAMSYAVQHNNRYIDVQRLCCTARKQCST